MKSFNSKGKIKYLSITLLFIIIMLIALSTNVKAASDITLKLSLRRETNSNGSFKYYGYSTSGITSNNFNIWKVVKVNGGGTIDTTTDFYCIKGGPGFESVSSSGTIEPKVYKDIGNLKDITTMRNNSVYNSLLPQHDSDYHKLLWLFDNFYTPNSVNALNEKKALLVKAGILTASEANSKTAEEINNNYMTDEQMLAVQQLAVWNITNNLPDDPRFYGEYVPVSQSINPHVLPEDDETKYGTFDYWMPLDDIDDSDFVNNMDALYAYFCNTAASKSSYNPVSVSGNNFITVNNNSATATENGSNYVIGPYKFTASDANVDFSLTYSFKDDNGHTANGVTVQGASASQTEATLINNIKNGTQFYLVVPKSSITGDIANYSFNIVASASVTEMEYWSEDHGVNGVNQPVAQIKRNIYTSNAKVRTVPEPEKVFDLALRKWLKTVDGHAVTNTREPNIDLSSLNSDTTATYRHRKDPYMVNGGSRVVFAIKIYNEGEVGGKCTRITDYLPADLTLATNSTINNTYGWRPGSGTNEYYTDYLSTKASIPAYDGTTLRSSEEVLIECVVKNSPTYNVITNIAEITSFTRDDGKTGDRDSSGDNANIPSDTTRPNYIGKMPDNRDLDDSNPNSYFKGQEDDDDFDRITIQPFDLALRKNVYSVNGVTLESRGETTKNPSIIQTDLSNGTKTTAEYNHRKNPTKVKVGDKVVFNITVYNEGPLSGYASIIEDYLPQGLEMVISDDINSINNQYGWVLSDSSRRKVNTSILSYESDRTGNLLNAYDGNTLSSKTIKIECVVTDAASVNGLVLTDIASIIDFRDSANQVITDRDSSKNNLSYPDGTNLSNYRGDSSNPTDLTRTNYFYKGQEDDDDFDKLVVEVEEPQQFDLKLIKHITNLNVTKNSNPDAVTYNRKNYNYEALRNNTATSGTDTYQATKKVSPVEVKKGDIIEYTIDVYNEGDISGFAQEITENIPEGLQFLYTNKTTEADIYAENGLTDAEKFALYSNNVFYKWKMYDAQGNETTNVANAKTLKTNYLSKENSQQGSYGEGAYATNNSNLLLGYNRDTMTNGPHSHKVVVYLKVATGETGTPITNLAHVTDDADENGRPVDDRDSKTDVGPGTSDEKGSTVGDYDDDEDYDVVILKKFDLALRKYITKIDSDVITSRIPRFTLNKDANGNYIYEHDKTPLLVETTDIVEYTIRVYNEGDVNGYASLIKDNIPEGLQFIPQAENTTNQTYRWVMLDANGNVTSDVTKAVSVQTDYLSREQGEIRKNANHLNENPNLIRAFNAASQINESNPDHKEVVIAFKVVAPGTTKTIITNTAEIKDDENENGEEVEDVDSTPDNNNPNEDDIDVEHVRLQYFDLALRKFITDINGSEVTTRYPQFVIDENGKYVYNHPKDPVDVATNQVVTYTIRVYNEGTMDGYANLVKDDLPDGLEFLPENSTNTAYEWEMVDKDGKVTTNVANAVAIQTDYLSKDKERGGRENLIKAFDLSAYQAGTITEPSYKTLKITFKVIEPNTSSRVLINQAQIADDKDKDGNDVVDIDSTPGVWNEGEDDQDIEKVKVKYFDLSLRKWITQTVLVEGGKQKVVNTGHNAEDDPEAIVKVELYKGTLNTAVVKFRYSIRVTNEGEIEGYAKEISDYIPEGLEFIPSENPEWTEKDGKVTTDALKDTLLRPGESAEVDIILQWINGASNLGLKTNTAEISEDENPYNTPDIDSTPNNKVPGEDDIDIAEVMLSIKTGTFDNSKYVIIAFAAFTIITTSIVLIRKYVA